MYLARFTLMCTYALDLYTVHGIGGEISERRENNNSWRTEKRAGREKNGRLVNSFRASHRSREFLAACKITRESLPRCKRFA